MASSSSSVRIGGWTYDVFLSFRGEDTRNNFVDHLHGSLVQKGIRVFKDDEMLRQGKPISSELLKAIEESRLSVVVFSENYANSSWCLDELAKIMDCQVQMGQKVLPVFYHVDPSDVRGQKRDFATAFQQHEDKFREEMDRVNKWRKALAAAGNLSGWHITAVNGSMETIFLLEIKTENYECWSDYNNLLFYFNMKIGLMSLKNLSSLQFVSLQMYMGESSFITKIVHVISINIQPRGMKTDLVDIESRIDKLNSLLDTETTHEVRMVGVCGMGGIGKTTIARALFKRISYKFDGSSFIGGVREKSKRDICVLQKQILEDVLATHHESIRFYDQEEGAEMIQTRFCNKKVLLVLDDVDNGKQLEFLAATHEWFGAGSRIIITTRNEHLLSDTDATYKPALLLKQHAVELFSRHAFRKNSPPEGYEELSDRVIRYTGGLPLALKVLGSFFRKREPNVWESALNRLAKTPNMEIFETLKLSFDGLEDSEKKIFLDIACFFKGHDEEEVTRILDSFGFYVTIGITTLVEKSLITISSKRIDMHDVLQEMGWEIVHKSYPNSRLWKPGEIHDFISKNMNLEVVEAIVHTNAFSREMQGFSDEVFKNMKNIRLLRIDLYFTSSKPTTLPDELRWLSWLMYPFSSLPVENLRKLVGLEIVSSRIQHLWMGYKFLPNLKFIHLNDLSCIESFLDVSGAPNVERLILSWCFKLLEVHKSLGTLGKLVYLNMSDCYNLKCLPSMIGMESLETLILSYCSSLEKFPEISSRMEKLSNIYLSRCSCLEIIPNSICELKNLKILNLKDCMALQQLPEELGSMEKLEELWLGSQDPNVVFRRPPKINNFHTWTKLCCLRKLDLSCMQIEEHDFPDNFHAFSSLEELYLSDNPVLLHLPASISHLSCLKHLELNECQQLQNIQGLPSGIQVLKACDCRALEEIEDLTEEYVSLHKISLSGCERLLENQENLNKMLQESFVKKCAAGDHLLSICIPGSKIPSWFEEQQLGHRVTLKLPPNFHTEIMGFVVCGVFQGKWPRILGSTTIRVKFGINRISIPESEVDYINASAADEKLSI
ncbi:hypothetical protein OSB04_028954 [Centaurea solstitialis]|uniref:ADP-ribosyl cyclase/cyclic ADP-ribose hydrolase n=1 Tax=Centaurea solstitialis TaxID=347529 RepID=A0AA38SP84_9ASTR|nr:hypothetical protein OSB04_028954 [Centaurea solstitialis]